ncbi:alpha/beta hydrolase [Levilactobacillus zymae]|uniref:alpha/beta hydrolase n=1 Tax=Levilactobacillus zymae TaxID=267363 RepID=UPI001E49CB2A|nr:alpha/beta hydrolase [Levilactobacillus zymae]
MVSFRLTALIGVNTSFKKQVKSFTQITVSGANANHANLPENQQIVRLIRQDLLD